MRSLYAAALTTTLALGLAVGPAQADDFCVTPQATCPAASTFAEPQAALDAASSHPGDDRVLIGPGTFSIAGQFGYFGPDPVEVRGAGPTQTVLRQTTTPGFASLLRIDSSAGAGRSAVSDLGIVVAGTSGGGGNAGAFLASPTDIRNVRVRTEDLVSDSSGIIATRGTISNVDVDLPPGPFGSTAVGVGPAPGTRSRVTLEDSTLRADRGLRALNESVTVLRRSQVTGTATAAVSVGTSELTAQNTLIRIDPHGAAAGIGLLVTSGPGAARADADHVTIVGGTPSSTAVVVNANTDPARAVVTDSIIRVPGKSFARSVSFGTPTADVFANHVSVHPTATSTSNPADPGTFSVTNVTTEDPRFLGDPALGEFRLRHDSPLIDRGSAVGGTTPAEDLAGAPRVVDGDGNGTAIRDLGAYEYQRRPPAITAAVTPSAGLTGDSFAWSASASDPDGDPITYGWSFSNGATATGQSVSFPAAAAGPLTGTATVTDATGLTGSASQTVAVSSPPVSAPPDIRPAEDHRGPAFSLTGRSLKLSAKDVIAVRVTCDAAEPEACKGTLRLASTKKVVRKKRVLNLGSKTFSIQPGRSANVSVKVSKASARTARSLRRVKVTATAVARDVAGNSATQQLTATLTAARARRAK